jgi:hypothetical protein
VKEKHGGKRKGAGRKSLLFGYLLGDEEYLNDDYDDEDGALLIRLEIGSYCEAWASGAREDAALGEFQNWFKSVSEIPENQERLNAGNKAPHVGLLSKLLRESVTSIAQEIADQGLEEIDVGPDDDMGVWDETVIREEVEWSGEEARRIGRGVTDEQNEAVIDQQRELRDEAVEALRENRLVLDGDSEKDQRPLGRMHTLTRRPRSDMSRGQVTAAVATSVSKNRRRQIRDDINRLKRTGHGSDATAEIEQLELALKIDVEPSFVDECWKEYRAFLKRFDEEHPEDNEKYPWKT